MTTLSKFLYANLGTQRLIQLINTHQKEIEEYYQRKLDMRFAFGEIKYLVEEHRKILNRFDLTSLENFLRHPNAESWIEITIREDFAPTLHDFALKMYPTILDHRWKCPKKCSGSFSWYPDCLIHMASIHGIRSSIHGNISCSYEPIKMFCMNENAFRIMTERTKKYLQIKQVNEEIKLENEE